MTRRTRRRNTARKRIAQHRRVREQRLCEAMGCRPRDAEPWLDPLTVVRDAVARSLAMRIDNDFINGDPATPGSFELKILNPATVYVPAAAVS